DGRVARLVVLAVKRHALLGPKHLDELDSFAHAREPFFVFGPCNAEGALIEVLAGADAKDHAAGIERAQRPEGLRDDRRMVSKGGRGHRRAEQNPLGALAGRREPCEGEWRVAVRVAPRLEVIAYENAVEAAAFSFDRELEQRARSELLGPRLVSKPEHGYLNSAPVVT